MGDSLSTLVAGVIEKGGSLAEVSMNHTSTVSPGDEVVAVGGAGEILKYFKADDSQGNHIVGGRLAEAIDEVAEPVRLQLERPHNKAHVMFFQRHAFMSFADKEGCMRSSVER